MSRTILLLVLAVAVAVQAATPVARGGRPLQPQSKVGELYDLSFLETHAGVHAWACCRVCPQNHLLEIDQLFGSTPPPVRRYDDPQPEPMTFLEQFARIRDADNCCNICPTGLAQNAPSQSTPKIPAGRAAVRKNGFFAPFNNLKFSLSRVPLPPCCPFCREQHLDEAFNLVVKPDPTRALPSVLLEAASESKRGEDDDYTYTAATPETCCNRCLREPTATESAVAAGQNMWPQNTEKPAVEIEGPSKPDAGADESAATFVEISPHRSIKKPTKKHFKKKSIVKPTLTTGWKPAISRFFAHPSIQAQVQQAQIAIRQTPSMPQPPIKSILYSFQTELKHAFEFSKEVHDAIDDPEGTACAKAVEIAMNDTEGELKLQDGSISQVLLSGLSGPLTALCTDLLKGSTAEERKLDVEKSVGDSIKDLVNDAIDKYSPEVFKKSLKNAVQQINQKVQAKLEANAKAIEKAKAKATETSDEWKSELVKQEGLQQEAKIEAVEAANQQLNEWEQQEAEREAEQQREQEAAREAEQTAELEAEQQAAESAAQFDVTPTEVL